MITDSRTKHELFEEWKNNSPNCSFTEWWQKRWIEEIHFYIDKGWYIIPLARRSKRPAKGYLWGKHHLTLKKAIAYITEDYNLAVVTGNSNLVVIDIDKRELPDPIKPFLNKTRVSITPRGWHFYFSGKHEDDVDYVELSDKLGKTVDTFRDTIQYVAVPLSICPILSATQIPISHPLCYEWVSKSHIMMFKTFANEILG